MGTVNGGAFRELIGRIGLMWLDKRPLSKDSRRARRIRKGKCVCEAENVVDDECPQHGTKEFVQPKESGTMLPQNTMRSSGISLLGLAPIIAIGLRMLGVADVCTPEEAEAGCTSADVLAASLLGGIGSILFVIGHARAVKREKADKAKPAA